MNEIITIEQQEHDHVTIAHLSDLHLVPTGSEPRFEANPDIESNWNGLIQDIAEQKPDLICVTGDIADNPFSDHIKSTLGNISRFFELLKEKEEKSKFDNWGDSLEKTFISAQNLLYRICEVAKIDPEASLYVVPGNHDYRIQGFIEEPHSRTLFDKVFKKHFRNQRILFNHTNQFTGEEDSMILSLVGFDSLAIDPFANFATGAISLEEYEKFKFFKQKLEGNILTRGPEFRVSLVHHHPLPVIPVEYFRQSKNQISNKNKGLSDIFQGEQGTLFKNPGSFLYGALKTGVNLILHGHQHYSWFTEVRYPSINDEHRMLVAGAASIGAMTNGKCKYNLIRLYRNGNITVEERSRERNPPDYKGEERLRLYKDSELRMTRNTQIKKRLDGEPVSTYPEFKYNMAKAEQIVRYFDIQQDGSAYFSATFTNLRATDRNVYKLMLANHYSRDVYTERPVVKPIDSHYTVSVTTTLSDDKQSSAWTISFSPPLSEKRPVTLSVTCRIFNVFDFVMEYRRARSDSQMDSDDSIGYSSQQIIPDRLIQTVSFPEKWRPPDAPKFIVEDEHRVPDYDEQVYHESSLVYIEKRGVVSISVDLPIPGYWYKLKWPLDNKSKYENSRYDQNLLNTARVLSTVSLVEKQDASKALLEELHDKFSTYSKKKDPLFNERTELSVFVTKYRPRRENDKEAIEVVLERLAFFGPTADSSMDDKCEYKGGRGLIGLACRSGETQTMRLGDDMAGYEFDALKSPLHTSLWCVPLKIPPQGGGSDFSRSPVYGVLCAGSFKDDGSLNKRSPRFQEFEEYVQTIFNRRICNILKLVTRTTKPVKSH